MLCFIFVHFVSKPFDLDQTGQVECLKEVRNYTYFSELLKFVGNMAKGRISKRR